MLDRHRSAWVKRAALLYVERLLEALDILVLARPAGLV
jgi:hypothetical protein